MSEKVYLAVDIGAGSGRVVAGVYDGRLLKIEEVHRFGNGGLELPSGWHWNVLQLFSDIQRGIAEARKRYGDRIVSLATATWGVDYGLLDARGRLLGLPYMYRDSRTDGMIEEACRRVPIAELYHRTGIQFLFFNTLFQLLSESVHAPGSLAAADRLLFMPDLLTYWLSGEKINERTISSTSQLLKAGTAEWDAGLLETMGIPSHLFSQPTEPGTTVGSLTAAVRRETGAGAIAVVACGSHDTASAIAGMPSQDDEPLFLSSGTWSLIGRELRQPRVSDETMDAGLSNEQGLHGTTRLLRNVAGMWLLQECKRQWDAAGMGGTYAEIVEEARGVETSSRIDPNDARFQKHGDMPAAISDSLKENGLPPAQSRAEMVRIILESLAETYGRVVSDLRRLISPLPETLHVTGGGSQNALLNQLTANATGLRVEAGPVEATAAGNVLAQLLADGEIASVREGRDLIQRSFPTTVFEPQ